MKWSNTDPPKPHSLQVINHIADNHSYGVVREYVGHGVGRRFHSAPTITHTRNNMSGTMQLWQSECLLEECEHGACGTICSKSLPAGG